MNFNLSIQNFGVSEILPYLQQVKLPFSMDAGRRQKTYGSETKDSITYLVTHKPLQPAWASEYLPWFSLTLRHTGAVWTGPDGCLHARRVVRQEFREPESFGRWACLPLPLEEDIILQGCFLSKHPWKDSWE